MRTFRNDSIKTRISMWYAVFIVLITVFLVGALLFSQNLSSQDYYESLLDETIDAAASAIHTLEDALNITEDTDRGVNITVLDERNGLIYGTKNFSVQPKEGAMRIRRANSGNYWYLTDKAVQLDDGSIVWLRGYISSEVTERHNRTIMVFLLIAMPVLLLIAVFGGFALTKRAFGPLDEIIHTAEGISATSDLKQRLRMSSQADEVGKLAETFDGMLERLEKSVEDEKSFLSDVSHELRTPISVIRAQSEFALSPERTTEEKDAALETILNRSTKAGQMISQMLLLSRMDFDKLRIDIERIDISELLGQIAQEMELRAAERNISIQCRIEDGVFCMCDELLIIRMVTNLLENAIWYGREGGHIWLELDAYGESAVIAVADDGIGISDGDREKIWQRFYQVNKSGGRSSGFGLGLSIVQWIVKAHGGSIAVRSALGEGSRFTVELPMTEKAYGHVGQ